MADAHGKLFKALMPPLGWKCPKRFKLRPGEPWESECSSDSDVDEAAIPEMKLSPAQSPPLLLKNRVDESHDVIQEALSDNDSVTDEMLILASQKFEEDEAQQYLGNDESNEILLLASQKFEENYSSNGQLLQCENLVASPKGQERFRGDPLKNSLEILMIFLKRSLEVLIYDTDHRKRQRKSMKLEGLVFLEKHKIRISGLQMYGVIGYDIGYRFHVLRRKKNNTNY